MSAYPTFSARIIGQTEKTLNAILDRLLAGTGLTEPLWVTLTLAAGDGSSGRGQFAGQVAHALKISEADARARLGELAAAGLLRVPVGSLPGDEARPTVTDAGRRLHGQIRAAVTEITERLWGDLPAEDLAAAGRVLSIILDRASAELAGA